MFDNTLAPFCRRELSLLLRFFLIPQLFCCASLLLVETLLDSRQVILASFLSFLGLIRLLLLAVFGIAGLLVDADELLFGDQLLGNVLGRLIAATQRFFVSTKLLLNRVQLLLCFVVLRVRMEN